MKQYALLIAMCAGSAYACPGNSDVYSPDPSAPNFNPLHPDADYDGDGIPNSEDPDDDNDGIPDCEDTELTPPTYPPGIEPPIWIDCPPWSPCTPLPPGVGPPCPGMEPWCDTDGDGFLNSEDDDDDNDGILDLNDPDHPNYDPTHPDSDPDCDGLTNAEDDDDDNDGIPDSEDANPTCPGEGPDPDPEPPKPPDPPDVPDPPEPPDRPDPPGDLPPGQPNPDPPDTPEPPDVPRPPGGGPIDPLPPGLDECCLAIINRLEVLIQWMDYQTGYLNATLTELNLFREDFFMFSNRLSNGDTGILDQTLDTLRYQEILMLEQRSLMYEDRVFQFDQTWYLGGIYDLLWLQINSDDAPDANPDEYTFESTTQNLRDLHTTNADLVTEYGHDFSLPDISVYSDEEAPPTIAIYHSFSGWLSPMPTLDVNVDLTPYGSIRLLVHTAMYLLVTIQGVHMIWGELRKT